MSEDETPGDRTPYDADGREALEALAEEAFTAGDLVGYRELRERAGTWPPPTGLSAAEMQAIASGDLNQIKPMLERNAERGAIDATRMLIETALRLGDVAEARRWVEVVERFGDPQLTVRLGSQMLEIGALLQVLGDEADAVEWFRRSAATGEAVACTELAFRAYREDQLDEARGWFTRAADGGDPIAMFMLALFAGDDGDASAARSWYERAAALDHVNAMTNLALILHEDGDPEGSREWLAASAERGCAGGALFLLLDEETRLGAAEALAARVDGSLGDDDALDAVLDACDLPNGEVIYAEDALLQAWMVLMDADPEAVGRPLLDAARRRYAHRAADGDTEAMRNLSTAEAAAGEAQSARAWLERAAALGDERAVEGLAALDAETDGRP